MISMPYFKAIAGSRSYGLEIESSDLDIICIGDRYDLGKRKDYHLIQVPSNAFIERIFDNQVNAFYLQWLFPSEFLIDSVLVQYIFENRENFVSYNQPFVYNKLFSHAERLRNYAGKLYDVYPKRISYAILFYAIINRYASHYSFAEAHKLTGEIKDYLLAARQHKLKLSDLLSKLESERNMAINNKSKFSFCDSHYIYKMKQDITDILN